MLLVETMSENWMNNQKLHDACLSDAAMYCKDYSDEMVQGCLRDNYDNLAEECKKEEFEELKVESQDIRMNSPLSRACKSDIKKSCGDVSDGNVLGCLTDILTASVSSSNEVDRYLSLFSGDEEEEERELVISDGNSVVSLNRRCSIKLTKFLALTSRDYRLKYGVTSTCQNDVDTICSGEKSDNQHAGKVLQCLMVKRSRIKNGDCKKEVKKLLSLSRTSFTSSYQLRKSCSQDVSRYCGDVVIGGGTIFSCLEENTDKLSEECKMAEFPVVQSIAEDNEQDKTLLRECHKPLRAYCKDLPGNELFACLSENLDGDEMTKRCETVVRDFMSLQSNDVKLNPRIIDYCRNDMETYCNVPKEFSSVIKVSDNLFSSKILDCLVDNYDDLKSSRCHGEVKKIVKNKVSDIKNDKRTKTACDAEIKEYCSNVKRRGDSIIHQCLSKNYGKLGEACKKEEFKIQELEGEEATFNPQIAKMCKKDMNMYCKSVDGENLMDCLTAHLRPAAKDAPDLPTGIKVLSVPCDQAVRTEIIRQSTNINFNLKMRKSCFSTMKKLYNEGTCKQDGEPLKENNDQKATPALLNPFMPSKPWNGEDIACLVENRNKITVKSCQTNLAFLIRNEVSSFI